MLTIEIEWAERNSSLPYCHYWADRWEKEEEVVMLPQKPRGTLQNDCWSFLKDRKWERSRFPKSRHHLHFALKVALSSTAPANGLSKFFVEQLAPELIRASAVEVKLNFHEGRKSWSQAAYSSSCWESKSWEATVTAAPSRWPKCQHLLLPWTPSPAWVPSAWPGRFAALAVCCCEQLPALPVPKQQGKSPSMWKSQ